ncbi:MAG: tocopherol cyclase family protein [Clostridia bacterium]|jgi:hypothetical protein
MSFIKQILTPEFFQGHLNKKNYFEGWYYKLISSDRKHSLAIIPGIAAGEDSGSSHSFIQINDSLSGKTEYLKFSKTDFTAHDKDFCIQIKENSFTRKSLSLSLDGKTFTIHGVLNFYDVIPFPKTLFRRSIMGPFGFIPNMECYHGILNIWQKVSGSLVINGETVDFEGGTGYIEKDWGISFPEAWIWLQANNFDHEGTSFMFSIAHIPWIGKSFTGIIAFLYHDGKYHCLATYNRAKITECAATDNAIDISLKNSSYQMKIKSAFPPGGTLIAPMKGKMEREITESISGTIFVTLYHKDKIIFSGESTNAGVEISGKMDTLFYNH